MILTVVIFLGFEKNSKEMPSEEPLVQRKDPHNMNTLILPSFYHVVLEYKYGLCF